jgi:hypothetical protein
VQQAFSARSCRSRYAEEATMDDSRPAPMRDFDPVQDVVTYGEYLRRTHHQRFEVAMDRIPDAARPAFGARLTWGDNRNLRRPIIHLALGWYELTIGWVWVEGRSM